MTPQQERKERLRRQQQLLGVVPQTAPSPATDEDTRREALRVAQDNLDFMGQEPQDPQDPSAFQRVVSEPLERSAQRYSDIGQRIVEEVEMMASPADMSLYDPSKGTDVGSVLIQSAAGPLALGFDMAANALMVGAGKGVDLVLPDSLQEDAKKGLMQFFQTEMGQKALSAMTGGMESWERFSTLYPNEAASITSLVDLGGAPSRVFNIIDKSLEPVKLSKIGLRKVEEPLEGIDKDVYKIAFEQPSGVKTTEQVKTTTDPQGVLRTQKQLATEEQLRTVDILKAAGVNGNKTLQENYNTIQKYLDKLDTQLEKALKGVSGQNIPTISIDDLSSNIRETMIGTMKKYPGLFKSKADKAQFRSLINQYQAFLKETGNTVQGAIEARRLFDDFATKKGIDLSGSSASAQNSAAIAIRSAVNDTISAAVPEFSTINSQKSALLKVMETVEKKAARETQNAVTRFVQNTRIDKLVGGTAGSLQYSGPLSALFGIAISPTYMLKNAMKRNLPARGRARVRYALRDVKNQLNEGLETALKTVKDAEGRKQLIQDRRTILVALEAAAQSLEKQQEEDTKDVQVPTSTP